MKFQIKIKTSPFGKVCELVLKGESKIESWVRVRCLGSDPELFFNLELNGATAWGGFLWTTVKSPLSHLGEMSFYPDLKFCKGIRVGIWRRNCVFKLLVKFEGYTSWFEELESKTEEKHSANSIVGARSFEVKFWVCKIGFKFDSIFWEMVRSIFGSWYLSFAAISRIFELDWLNFRLKLNFEEAESFLFKFVPIDVIYREQLSKLLFYILSVCFNFVARS